MKHYTLFVDEAGNFGYISPEAQGRQWDKRWVVGGVLFPLPPEAAMDKARKVLETNAVRHRNRLDNLPNPVLFHVSGLFKELRNPRSPQEEPCSQQETVERVSAFIGDVLAGFSSDVLFFAITNPELISLSESEMTYRTMLTELVALVDSTLKDQRPDKLSLVIAQRTIDGKRTSPVAALDEALLRNLKTSLTVGLASLRLVNLLEKNKLPITLEKGTENWGLRAADFLVSRILHQEESEGILVPLRQARRLYEAKCFRDSRERRAYVSWRDGDYVGALYSWSFLSTEQAGPYLTEVFRDAYQQAGSDQLRALIASLIERFQREEAFGAAYSVLFDQMHRLLIGLEKLAEEDGLSMELSPALFNLRTYTLLAANHLGSPPEMQEMFAAQERQRSALALIPENLPLLLMFDLSFIETAVNALDFPTALKRATRYRQMIQVYQACWEITAEEMGDSDAKRGGTASAFLQSRTHIIAETAFLRVQILVQGMRLDTIAEILTLEEIAQRLRQLLDLNISHNDRSRVWNHLLWVQLKQHRYAEALEMARESLAHSPNCFDIFWAARAAGDTALAISMGQGKREKQTEFPVLRNDIDAILAYLQGEQCTQIMAELDQHPVELILRERGLLEYLVGGEKHRARHYYELSEKRHRSDSPIYRWLSAMLAQQKDYPNGNGRDLTAVFTQEDSACQWLAEQMPLIEEADPMRCALRRSRAVTPY